MASKSIEHEELEIRFQHNNSLHIFAQLYHWKFHVSSLKKNWAHSDKYIYLIIRILHSNQTVINPGLQKLDEPSYPSAICYKECTWDTDVIVITETNGVIHVGRQNISQPLYEMYGHISDL